MPAEMISRINEVIVLCWNTPSISDQRAQKIAAHLGAEATFVALTTSALDDATSMWNTVPRCTCLIVDAEVLAKAAQAMPDGVSGMQALAGLAEHVLIYGLQATDSHSAILRTLSSGGLVSVQPLPSDAKFHISGNHREWCGQFSGLSVRAVDPSREKSFVGAEGQQQDMIIRASGQPFFVRTKIKESQVFFWPCSELADLDENVPRGSRPSSWFSRLVPLMMFLRGALGNRLWHNDSPQACITIDDPLLKGRYGFLEYARLLDLMRKQQFCACIAFIPWNYRRSSKEVGTLVSSTYARPFLCVHGCDHTHLEFASTDFKSLLGKARLALERMRIHSQLSGVAFDDVMVFPQGCFSAEAVTALKSSGYLAAVNGDVCPVNRPEAFVLRDLLEVAVTRFAGFPLFGRRYPCDLADFAFDLFIGKPALVVEHHEYFRNGYGALENFVEQLNALDPRLEWTNLGTICSHACMTKRAENGDVHVRFYTNRFTLQNHGTETRKYLLYRRLAHAELLPSVTVDGREWVCQREGDSMKIFLSLEAGQTTEIRILSEDSSGSPIWKPTELHNAKVWVRRLLSEFRDNHVGTTKLLRQGLTMVVNFRTRRKAGRNAASGGVQSAITFLTMLPACETLARVTADFSRL